MDGCGNGRTGRNKGSLSEQPNPVRAERRRTDVIIHLCNTPGGERGARREREEDGHKFPLQKPVYYVSTVLTPIKSRYPHYQKIAYAVFMASRKLRHYFQECSIMVASEVPLNDIINNCNATGRIAKWAIELLPFDITYKPRRAIKSKYWPTSSPNGQRPNSLKSMVHITTGSCTSMALKCWRAYERALS